MHYRGCLKLYAVGHRVSPNSDSHGFPDAGICHNWFIERAIVTAKTDVTVGHCSLNFICRESLKPSISRDSGLTVEIRQKNSAIWIKIITTLFVIFLFYWQDFTILYNEALNNEIVTHIISVPFIMVASLYRLRKRVKSSILIEEKKRDNEIKYLIGFILCFSAYLIKIYGSYTFYSLEYHVLSLPVFISGIILILFNYNTLNNLRFPTLFTLFL
ncbi:hypothetical protein E4H04_11010, partial [Candidatus Bathyarchaeota archaeon]